MAKKQLKPDTVLKNYWNVNEHFADLYNGILFDGKQVIKSEELEDVDTEEATVMEHRKYIEIIRASRDNIKIHKKSAALGIEFVLLGLESQEHIHYAMPMRVMGYDYSTYKKQYDINAAKNKNVKNLNKDEYLSKMKKTDKFTPVITTVVYYGEKEWDGAKSLHEMLNLPKEVEKYVNDYKMFLIEARQNNLTLHNMDNKDLFELLRIILDNNISKNEAKQKAIRYSEEHKTDKSVIMTVAGATNMKLDYNALERGSGNMCTLFDEIAKEGREEGKAEGLINGRAAEIVEMGHEFGLSEKDILSRLQNKLNVSLQMAQEYLEMFGKQMV